MLIIGGRKHSDTIEETLTIDSFDSLKIKVSQPDVKIFAGEKFEVRYVGPKELLPSVTRDGNTLILHQRVHGIFSLTTSDEVSLEIEVPQGANLTKLYAELNSGDLEISGISGGELKLHVNSGDSELENCLFAKAKIELNSGDFEVENSKLDLLKFNGNSGDCELTDSKFKVLRIELNSGDNVIHHCKVEDEATIATVSGDNRIVDTPFGEISYATVLGDNKIAASARDESLNNKLSIETVNGDNRVE